MIKTNHFLEPHVGEDDGFFQPCSSDTVGIEGVKIGKNGISCCVIKEYNNAYCLPTERPSNFLKLKISGDFFYRKATIWTTIEANNGTYCLRKRIEKFPLRTLRNLFQKKCNLVIKL